MAQPQQSSSIAMKKPRSLVFFTAVLLLASAGRTSCATYYVDQNSTNSTPPYTNWATAATNIQDAIDAAVAGDEVVVTNGLYATGGRAVYGTMTSVAVDEPLLLRSVNGPQFTVIDGRHSNRCVYLTNGASLYGFTLANGFAAQNSYGGGLYCQSVTAVISNCVLSGNSVANYGDGGGAYNGTLNDCTLSNNWAPYGSGGGAVGGTLHNCTLSGNSADRGGGAASCTLNNCTLTGNWASGGGGAEGCTLKYCTLTGNS